MRSTVLLAVTMVVALAGCTGAPSPTQHAVTAQPGLRQVSPLSAEETSQVALFIRRARQPGPMYAPRFRWPRLAARDVPRAFVPADTAGRGLLVALAISSQDMTPTASEPPVQAHLLFQRGLSLSVGRELGRTARPTLDDWNRWVAQQTRALMLSNYSGEATASLGSGLAVVRVGHGFFKPDVVVSWFSPPWIYELDLESGTATEALRIARSVGR